MKLLPDSLSFEHLNACLNFNTTEGNTIGRLESYSCKMVGKEKVEYKKFRNDSMSDNETLSPPGTSRTLNLSHSVSPPKSNSSYNGACNSISTKVASSWTLSDDEVNKKTLFYLISTLNASFYPDYEFSSTTPQEFSRETSLEMVIKQIERQLLSAAGSSDFDLSNLWSAIDDVICLHDCEIYSYNPGVNSDPYSDDGCLWSMHYFFYNVKLKRIVFFTCRAVNSHYDSYFMSSNGFDFDDDLSMSD